jgi:adenine-specific DNA-methyltransferase
MAKQNYNKLELTWIGKGEEPKLEPRILIENPEYSYGDPKSENMLIHGDNLLALKALEQDYSGKVKCIYIDPPYNTGNAFEHYDDGVEHSLWLSLIKPRIEILRKLLTEDGSLWITLDDNEAHYFKVMCDEIFGRNNFVATTIWQQSLQSKGYPGKFSVHHNYTFCYRKSDLFTLKSLTRTDEHNKNYSNPDNDPKGPWRSGDVRNSLVRKNLMYNIITPSGKIINHPPKGWRFSEETFKKELADGKIYFSTDESRIIRKIYLSDQEGRVPETIWFASEVGSTRDANAENKILFPDDPFATPKPEALLERIIELSSNVNDIILDSFLGSGTTAAVAHKMGRNWIGVELGEHAKTHCHPRLKAVVDGEQGGISSQVEWKGGGGFKFYNLAPSLLNEDKYGNWIISKEYNAQMLASAVAKQEGFKYEPDEHIYWKQGVSSEKDFIFTTTQFITAELMDKIHDEMQPGESILIACKSYQEGCENRHANISIKKIPHLLLGRCEFGKDDYSFNIVNMSLDDESENWVEPDNSVETISKKNKKIDSTPNLFD